MDSKHTIKKLKKEINDLEDQWLESFLKLRECSFDEICGLMDEQNNIKEKQRTLMLELEKYEIPRGTI